MLVTALKAKPRGHSGLWLSVSKVKTFKQCPAKYRYYYIERLPSKVWDHHVFGNLAHEALELFHKKIIDGDHSPWNELMTSSFSEAIRNSKNKISSKQKKGVWEILNKYLVKVSSDLKGGTFPRVLNVEAKFFIDLNGKVLLNGYIDRIQLDPDNVLHVSDYKTTKNKKYLVGDYFQLMTYAYVMCVNDPDLEKVRTSYMLLRHDFSTIEKEYKRDQIMKMGETFLEQAEKINNEKLWRPKPTNLCRFCDYLSKCKSGRDLVEGKTNTNFGVSDW